MADEDFDCFGALKQECEIREAERQCVKQAIALIEGDRPNAAKRLLTWGIVEEGVDKGVKAER